MKKSIVILLIVISRMFIPETTCAQNVINQSYFSDKNYFHAITSNKSVQIGNRVYFLDLVTERPVWLGNPYEFQMMKFDLNGNLVNSTQIFPNETFSTSIFRVKKSHDNNLLVLNTRTILGQNKTFLSKIDLTGSLVWETLLSLPVNLIDQSHLDMVVLPNGDISICGIAFSFDGVSVFNHPYIWMVGKNGGNEYFKTYGTNLYANSLAYNGSHLFFGVIDPITNSQGNSSQIGYLIKIDAVNGDSLSSIYLGPGSGMVDMEFISPDRLFLLIYNQAQNQYWALTANTDLSVIDSISLGSNFAWQRIEKQNNGLYVFGHSVTESKIFAFSTTGTILWSNIYSDTSSFFNSITLTLLSNGKAMMFGVTDGGPDGNDLKVLLLSKPSCTMPTADIISSAPAICFGGTVTLQSVDTSIGNLYEWRRYGVFMTSGTESFYEATRAGNYKLVVTSHDWCSKKSVNAEIINGTPTLANTTIIASGPTTFCLGDSVTLSVQDPCVGCTYQWKKYSNDIIGVTGESYTATTFGKFRVVVTSQYGCARPSQQVLLERQLSCLTAEVNDERLALASDNSSLNIFPNPAFGNHFAVTGIKVGDVIQVLDMSGREVSRIQAGAIEEAIDISGFKPGMYIVRVGSQSQKLSRK